MSIRAGRDSISIQQRLNFHMDSYGPYAGASANTILRSALACAILTAAQWMLLNMGIRLEASLVGGISHLAFPVP